MKSTTLAMAAIGWAVSVLGAQEQPKDKSKQTGPSDAEQKAMAKVEAAPNLAAKIAAAGEFVKKYPKRDRKSTRLNSSH